MYAQTCDELVWFCRATCSVGIVDVSADPAAFLGVGCAGFSAAGFCDVLLRFWNMPFKRFHRFLEVAMMEEKGRGIAMASANASLTNLRGLILYSPDVSQATMKS